MKIPITAHCHISDGPQTGGIVAKLDDEAQCHHENITTVALTLF
jgi:hypothetical protein